MEKTINPINMNDIETMMKKSGSDEEEPEDEEENEDDEANEEDEDQNSSSSISNDNRPMCFHTGETTLTSKSLIERQMPTQVDNKHSKSIKMHSQLKRNYASICLFAFLVGTDFAVIIPTLWDRLSIDYEASGAFMGLVISSYSLSGVICGLIMGKQLL